MLVMMVQCLCCCFTGSH